jgi:hypothetical protein
MNVSKHASLWFGAQFTNSWYRELSRAIGYAPANVSGQMWSSGTVILSRNLAVTDYTDLNFFFCWVNFFTDTGAFAWVVPPTTVADWRDQSSSNILPNITTTLDTFAKSLYSLLLSDFGVVDHTNALLTPAGVKWLGDQVDLDLRKNSEGMQYGNYSGQPRDVQNAFNASAPPYVINETYQSVADASASPLDLNNTTPSRIFTQYLCSVPRRKGGGALFFAVLLADLVFLQTAWTLLDLGAGWWLKRVDKDGTAGYCEGCAKRWTTGAGAKVEVPPLSVESLGSTLKGGGLSGDSLSSTLKDDGGANVDVRARSRSGSAEGEEQRKPLLPEASDGRSSDGR